MAGNLVKRFDVSHWRFCAKRIFSVDNMRILRIHPSNFRLAPEVRIGADRKFAFPSIKAEMWVRFCIFIKKNLPTIFVHSYIDTCYQKTFNIVFIKQLIQ